MTKNDIDAYARYAAEDIRRALEKFSGVTGLSAEVNVRWIDVPNSSGHPEMLVDSVEITPILFGVKA